MGIVRRATMRRLALAWLVLECLALLGFWMWLWMNSGAASWWVAPKREGALEMFVLADLGVLALSALGTGWGCATSRSWARAGAWFHCGAAAYATAATIGGCVAGVFTARAALVMAPLAAGAVLVALAVGARGDEA